ncbi:hypothetical protein GLOIN_2v1780468 [Rhizophagus clarus]|uniref:Galactose oxidase n=1 Tax=Rhizophagus clarus TaxID=94130 RepID=A0A8H3LAS5_9GLOM|nr:hypothetical protein GLOIN_2v1780468 [Rhizophagus clarus]
MAPNEKLYLFGGRTNSKQYVNDMFILDTVNFIWGKGSSVNASTPRGRYGAALLPNNKIIYIGGNNDPNIIVDPKTLKIRENSLTITLNEVYIYDIINDSWNTEQTTGKIPSNKGGFSTVLGLDAQKVIIYGGYFNDPGYLDNTLYVLDLTDFNWYIPNVTGNIPKPRANHKANIIGKYMIISFGMGYDKAVESDILLLDISNNEEYIWTTILDPPVPNVVTPLSPSSSSSPSPSPLPSSVSSPFSPLPSSSQPSTVGAIVGILISGIFLLIGSFFIYKWHKNNKIQKTNYENKNYNNHDQEEVEISIEKENNNNEERIIQISLNENTINGEPTPVASEKNDYHGQEIMETLKNENTNINHEPTIIPISVINESNGCYGQEIMETFENENPIYHEPVLIPSSSVINENNDYDDQEIMESFKNENITNHEPVIKNESTTNHEPIIPTSALVTSNHSREQEVISTSNNDRLLLQIFKDEMLQAVKQEISQNLKNEIIQAVRGENFNYNNVTKNNERQDQN